MTEVGNLNVRFTLDAKSFTTGLGRVESQFKNTSSRIEGQARNMSSVFDAVNSSIARTALGLAAMAGTTYAAYSSLAGITKARAGIDSIKRSLEFATGSAERAAEAFDFVEKSSVSLGADLKESAKAFASLSATVKGTSLEGEGVREVFLAVQEASVVLGLDAQRTERAFVALQQMMSKGKVTAEELNGQLAEQIPGALNIMSRALGITTKQLSEAMQQGDLAAEKVLPLFAKQLRQEVSPQIKDLGENAQTTLGKVSNAWFNLVKTVTESKLMDTVVSIMNGIATSVNAASSAISFLNEEFIKFNKTAIHGRLGLNGMNKELKEIGEVYRRYDFGATSIYNGLESINVFQEAAKWAASSTAELETQVDALGLTMEKLKVPEAASEIVTIFEIGQSALMGFEETIVDFVRTGSFSFEQFARDIIAEMTRIAIHLRIVLPLMQAWAGFLEGGGLKGGSVFSSFLRGSSGILGFAKGGIIKEPIAGIGMLSGKKYAFGEKGPEAIVPLDSSSRDASLGSTEGIEIKTPRVEVPDVSADIVLESPVIKPPPIELPDYPQVEISPNIELPDYPEIELQENRTFSELKTLLSNKSLFPDPETREPKEGPKEEIGLGNAGQNNIVININAVDSNSLVSLMRANPEAITAPLSDALSLGDRGVINSIRGVM